eukprot:CAMPEP_0180237938 /NCGR_PEP_ID=MMETSP0987-20121128/30645_1 /TAXON_ID=697907 /ORGANISM="non described non described, Strain CCMP2293" /LENGTH=52 /DNA_ID=CAMNT_0022204395 /DNA_START=124 /DNA_END=278 /DNA_ORIENTATION=+
MASLQAAFQRMHPRNLPVAMDVGASARTLGFGAISPTLEPFILLDEDIGHCL